MAKISHLIIDSLSENDVNDLFEAICKKITHLSSLEVKREVLKLSGDDKSLSKKKVNVAQLIQVILLYDIPMELKLSYVPKDAQDKESNTPPAKEPGLVESHTQKIMSLQKEEVILEDVNKNTPVASQKPEVEVKADELPPPPDFMS